jgi:cystathionine beta-lyase
MHSIFDEVIDRQGTNCIKYDFKQQNGKPDDVIPLWVADMDFRAPQPVLNALEKAVKHGIFGYSDSNESYYAALEKWMNKRFHWNVSKEWLVKTPGVVFALNVAVRALTKPNDSVMICQPVYTPFSNAVLNNQRRLVISNLVLKDGIYYFDFDDIRSKMITEQVKAFILCSPHNPVGRVWTKEELTQLASLCLEHGVTLISDEIHQDFVYPPYQHTVTASLSKEIAMNTITCTAPSKTFNIAGLQASNIWIPNPEYRSTFRNELERIGIDGLNAMALVACKAAYEGGEEWLEELLSYLQRTIQWIDMFLKENLPRVKLIPPQGTYLLWLDFRELGLSPEQLNRFLVEEARIWLNGGEIFGAAGEGFARVNIGAPLCVIQEAMYRLKSAVDRL